MNEMFLIFLLFYNDLDLNNQKILCLPSIFQFERTVHNLNHPNVLIWNNSLLINALFQPLPTQFGSKFLNSIGQARVASRFDFGEILAQAQS